MNLKCILQEIINVADKIESIAIKLSNNYPLIPSNIVAIKKAETLEKEVIELRQRANLLDKENQQLIDSISRMANELDSIDIDAKSNKEPIDEKKQDQSIFGSFNSNLTSQNHVNSLDNNTKQDACCNFPKDKNQE